MTYDNNTPVWRMTFNGNHEVACFFSAPDMIQSFYMLWSSGPDELLSINYGDTVIIFYVDNSQVARGDLHVLGEIIYSTPIHL